MKKKTQLNAILVEAVNEGLTAMCSSAASSVIFFLKQNGSIKSEASIHNLKAFSEGLEQIFGFGSKVIERKILEVLYIKLRLPPPRDASEKFNLRTEIEKVFELYESLAGQHREIHSLAAIEH